MSQDKFTRMARGRDCLVRLPEICLHDTDTVVFAHIRLAGITGISMKAPSILGCPACFNCHNAIDRRSNMDLDRDFVRLAHFEGMARWINYLFTEGKIK